MGRKSRTSLFEDLISASATLPWWLGLFLAVVAYGFFHHFASLPQAPITMQGLATFGIFGFWRVLAGFAQWLVPIGLLFGSLLSVIKQIRNRRRFETTAQIGTRSSLLDMSWQEFEQLVAEHFRRQGYHVAHTARAGPDGGVDIELRKGDELSLVQAKQWRSTAVGVATVRELYGVMAARGATHAFVVTSGCFTADAAAFADGRNITLIDGSRLISAMGTQRQNAVVNAASAVNAPQSADRSCPSCGSRMIRRVAKKGPTAGSAFWGCSQYPSCRGTAPIN